LQPSILRSPRRQSLGSGAAFLLRCRGRTGKEQRFTS
jgi:hypothetical protein